MNRVKVFQKWCFLLIALVTLFGLTACKVGFTTDDDDDNGNGGGDGEELRFIGPGSASTWHVELFTRDNTFEITRRNDPGADINMTITGTFERFDTGFTRLNVSNVVDESNTQIETFLTALEIADEHVLLLPVETSSDQIIATISADNCPEDDLAGNWILYDAATDADASNDEGGAFGSYTYSVNSGNGIVTTLVDLETLTIGGNIQVLETDSCDDGISEGETAIQYVSPYSVLAHTNTDNAATSELLFVMEAKEIVAYTELEGEYAGFYFDSTFAVGNKSIPVSVSCDDAGGCNLREVENIQTGVLSTAVYALEFVDTPGALVDGFITGTISDSQGNEGNIACNIDVNFLDEDSVVWACVGQSPTDNTEFINLFLATEE